MQFLIKTCDIIYVFAHHIVIRKRSKKAWYPWIWLEQGSVKFYLSNYNSPPESWNLLCVFVEISKRDWNFRVMFPSKRVRYDDFVPASFVPSVTLMAIVRRNPKPRLPH